MIESISHITFIVSDLDKMSKFLSTIFDAKEVYSSGGSGYSISKEKFLQIGDLWVAIMEGAALAEQTYNHLAFKIPDSEYDSYLNRIASLGVEILSGRDRLDGEGRSIYFYDYDNHLFELHTGTLDERLRVYNSHPLRAQ